MLLVILGAGASYDSPIYDGVARPHLAKELFDGRQINQDAMSAYGVAQPLIIELRRLMDSGTASIEDELAKITTQAETNPAKKSQLMAMRFYLSRVVSNVSTEVLTRNSGATNYVPFIDKLQTWQNNRKQTVCIINFNYDFLLENALRNVGISWNTNTFEDYTNRDDFKLIKPHGSVDWCRWSLASIGQNEQAVINEANKINLDESTLHLNIEGMPAEYTKVPALAAPVTGKTSFECPDNMLHELKAILPNVSHLLTIGWRGAETHFLPLLQQLDGVNLMVVSNSLESVGEINSNLRSIKTGRVNTQYEHGFANFIYDKEFGQFLNS